MTLPKRTPRRRDWDSWRGVLCWFAWRGSDFWDFIDKRQVDKHAVSIGIFYGTIVVMRWAMAFVAENDQGTMTGIEMAAVIGSVVAPYMALQAAAVKWYFESRAETKT